MHFSKSAGKFYIMEDTPGVPGEQNVGYASLYIGVKWLWVWHQVGCTCKFLKLMKLGFQTAAHTFLSQACSIVLGKDAACHASVAAFSNAASGTVFAQADTR